MRWLAVGVLIVAGLLLAGIVLGRTYFPRIVVQPVDHTVWRMLPEQRIFEKIRVPGPIRFVPRTVIREVDRFILVTRPPEALTPRELEEARKRALRRFVLTMEIPANQQIPCATPAVVEGGVACGEAIRFQAELLEPSPGVIVPIVIPGEISRPLELRIEARAEAVAPVALPRWLVYPLGAEVAIPPTVRLLSGISYRAPGPLGSTLEGRAEYLWGSGFRGMVLVGWTF